MRLRALLVAVMAAVLGLAAEARAAAPGDALAAPTAASSAAPRDTVAAPTPASSAAPAETLAAPAVADATVPSDSLAPAPAGTGAPGPADSLSPEPFEADTLERLLPAPAVLKPGRERDATRLEIGLVSEASNEQFFEDQYGDTMFLGRRLHSLPDARVAVVLAGEIVRTGADGRTSVHWRPDFEFGDEVARAGASVHWSRRTPGGWRFVAEPSLGWRRDLAFGYDRREARAALHGRVSHPLGAGDDALELSAGGDLLDTRGSSDPFALSHRVARAGVAWDHLPLLGWERRLSLGAVTRQFPDSTDRDHYEGQLEASLRGDVPGGPSLRFDSELQRRDTARPEASTRDRFLAARARGESEMRFGDAFSVVGTVEGEWQRYDQPDSVVDFDYAIARGTLECRFLHPGGWTASAGGRVERLIAAWNPGESYHELSARFSAERVDSGRWWLLEPAAGRRSYDSPETPGVYGGQALHSPYWFAELGAFGDASLPQRLRLRLTGTGRIERHDDASQDVRSLYILLDVRRLF